MANALSEESIVQVLAGAEAATGAGHEHHADRPIKLDPIQRMGKLAMHGLGEGVKPVRTVQGDGRDAVGQRQQNGR